MGGRGDLDAEPILLDADDTTTGTVSDYSTVAEDEGDEADLADTTAGPADDQEPMEEEISSVRKITALIKQRRKENGFDPERIQKTGGMTAHNFRPVKWTGKDDSGSRPSSEPTTLGAKDLTSKSTTEFGDLSKVVTSKGLVQYVVLQRVRATKGAWILPTEQQFHDVMNLIECQMLGDGLEIINVLQWANMWDAVGVIGLSTVNLPLLKEFLEFVSKFGDGTMEYSTIPKEFVVEDTSLTTILRNNNRKLDLQTFPMALFHRNPGLRGGELHVTHSQTYGAGDKTRAGQPKEGWRLLFLKGCLLYTSPSPRD